MRIPQPATVTFPSTVDYIDSLNATQSVQIRVVSQDGATENFYTLNVTESDEYVKPALLDMTLEAPDGTQIEGDIDTVEGQNVVKFELPYEIFDTGELDDWKLFYTKTVGASITYDEDHTNGQNNIALPKTGAPVVTDRSLLARSWRQEICHRYRPAH